MAYTTISKHTDYFNTVLYTGNGSTQSITGVGFQPDLAWIKRRDGGTAHHQLFDVTRGANKRVYSSSTAIEDTATDTLTSFDSDGFSVGANAGVNGSSNATVAWNWKAGTTGSGYTTGSGTSKDYEYAVNTTAGFSIVKYKGNGTAGHTIPHHLGVVPKMILIKCIESTHNWEVYHSSLGATKYLQFTSSGAGTNSNRWNNVAPSSTVFTVGTEPGVNQSSSNFNFVAYCFAEKTGFSKFGQYTGNGSSNGTFTYTGFRPSFIMVKRTNATDVWHIIDNKRDPINTGSDAKYLDPASNGAEYNNSAHDFYSNGFKIRASGTNSNASGAPYIYMAFGQSLVGSNNVPCTAR